MRTSTRMTLAAGWATALGAVPLGAVYDTWHWVWFTWAAIGAVVAAHLLARSLRLPAWLVPLAGAAGLLEYLVVVFASNRAFVGLLPSPGALAALWDGIRSGFGDVHDLAAPVPATRGLVLLTAGSVGLVTIAVDVVAVALRRPAAAGLALLALYAVPTAVASDGVAWPLFVLGATGYLVLLMVEGRDRLLRWGRPVGSRGEPDDAGEEAPPPLTGQRIGAVALAAAVIVPLFVPGLTTNALSRIGRTGVGVGTGTGTGALSPFVALKGQLLQPEPKELFQIQGPAELWYVRLKVLEKYIPSGWIEEPQRPEQRLDGDLSLPSGQPRSGTEMPYTAQVVVTGSFRDDALPTFFWPQRIQDAPQEWGYDPRTGVVVGGPSRRGGFTYTLNGYEPRPTREELAAAPDLPADNEVMRALGGRPSVPSLVRKRVEEAVAGKNGPYERALALHDYFKPDNGFTYSTQTKTGDSGSALVDFLTSKQGFCEQYAAAMAVMLRLTGIPSRVVVGYTHRTRSTEGVWSIQTRDAHAWVEAYFGPTIGWVPFDPTPLADGRSVDLPWAPHATAPTSPTPSASGSSGSAGSGNLPSGRRDPNDLDPTGSGGGRQPGLFTPRTALGSLGLLALVALVLWPGVGRVLVRRRRLHTAAGADPPAAACAAWDEVLASAEDYGIAVPDTETPRRTAARLAREYLDPPAAAGLRLAALAEERARYAPVAGVEGDLPTAVRAVRHGLRATLSGRDQWQAAVLPRSTLRAARAGVAQRAEHASMSLSRLVDGLRRAVVPRRLAARRTHPQS